MVAGSAKPRHAEAPTTVIGVVGLGVLGGTVAEAFSAAGVPTRGFDPYLGIGSKESLAGCSVVFLCVPSPLGEDGAFDLREVWAAARDVADHAQEGTIVANKSTVPPGTCDALAQAFPTLEFAAMPEFLVGARAMETFTRPDRVLIGARSGEAAATLADLMARVAPTAPVVVVGPSEAELAKLCSNAMLAAKVTLANELAEICRRFGVPWSRVQGVVGLDRRIGPDHLSVTPERGFGGSCLPKDLDGLIGTAKAAGHEPRVLEEIAAFNRRVRGKASEERDGIEAYPPTGESRAR
jgi:UDPglucose 6-dehydrogenase